MKKNVIFLLMFFNLYLIGQKADIIHSINPQGIIGGDTTFNPGYIVSLHNQTFGYLGVGVIVDERTIVSAAHVIDNYEGGCEHCITIRAGSNTIYGSTQEVNSESIVLHNSYIGFSNSASFDIGIIKTDVPLVFDANVQPIEIAKSCNFLSSNFSFGTTCEIFGWGATSSSSSSNSSYLKSSVGMIYDLVQSPFWVDEPIYQALYNINSMHAVYSSSGQAYYGDSGGPCVITQNGIDFLAGIISWGVDPAESNNPNIYYPTINADVFKTRDFIIENMEPGYSCDMEGPTLKSNILNLECDGSVNLNVLFEGQVPAGHELRWSTDSDPFNCIEPFNLGEITAPGTYYGYFFNFSFNCYSRASEPVEVLPVCKTNDNFIVSTNLTITYPLTFNRLEVKDGAILTIKNTEIKILDEIFVSNGSKLIIDGAIIKNCEICPKWNGVRIAGHLAFVFNNFNPGRVEMKNGASISNAIVGVDMRESLIFPFINNPFTFGGGVLTMSDNSTISNCDKGIHFAPYGWGSIAGYGTPDEQSSITNSSISSCDIGIYLENNIGLEILNSTFVDNYPDIVANSSSFDLGNSTLNSGIEYNAEYPSLVGGNIYNNNFVEADVMINSQGNIVPFTLNGNSHFGSGLFVFGDLDFTATNNDFYDSGIGIAAWESGDNQYNLVMDNAFYNNQYANSTYGANDIEYLTNCFENTDYYDIELYFNASIHESQGDPSFSTSAGNCFDYYAKIGTGSGSEHFDYWTKDGYVPSANCKYPGNGNFTRQRANEELAVDNCGSGLVVSNLPPAYRDCECLYGDQGCKETINALKNEIALLESNTTMNPWVKRWLIAKYKRCLDRLKKTYIRNLLGEGKKEDAISFTSSDTSFRYQIIAYAIMMNEMEHDRAHSYLNNLNQENAITYDFITAQNIYHSYLHDRNNYTLSTEDRNTLFDISTEENPYSGYARSIYYLLTGEKVNIELSYIDGNITYPRSGNSKDSNQISIYPNPLEGEHLEVNFKSFDSESYYTYDIISASGKSLKSGTLIEANNSLPIIVPSGLYLLRIHKNGALIKSEKLVKI